eukprot:5276957-Pyramimonas_sp.AAC.1
MDVGSHPARVFHAKLARGAAPVVTVGMFAGSRVRPCPPWGEDRPYLYSEQGICVHCRSHCSTTQCTEYSS